MLNVLYIPRKIRLRCWSVLLLGALCFFGTTGWAEAETSAGEEDFQRCIRKLQREAAVAGYSEYIYEDVITNLKPVEQVLQLDRRQPEFTESFFDYYKRRVTIFRVAKGRELLQKYSDLLDELSRVYGVPAHYLLAFWGMETNFGSYLGKMSVLDSLATLACDERRSDYFTSELFDVFHLLDNRRVRAEQLQGSWAGAMGNMQFMPSALRQYGIDGDGDGRVDVWDSVVDALHSAANFLQQIGWQRGELWGREVVLPEEFDFSDISLDTAYSLRRWRNLGITTTNDKRIPDVEMTAQLVLPNGHRGPAFLVYDNYEIILKWNRSRYYALAVGLLADKIADRGNFYISNYPEVAPLKSEQVVALQNKLADMGYRVGKADGIVGSKTRKALRLYQQEEGLVADGYPSREVLDSLGIL